MQRPFPADDEMVQNHPQSDTGKKKAENIVDSKKEEFDGKDYSNADTVLKEGIKGKGDPGKVKTTETKTAEIPIPTERIKNPFSQLSNFATWKGKGGTLQRRGDTWQAEDTKDTIDDYNRVMKTAKDFEDSQKKPKTPVSPIHPDVAGDIGSQIVDKMMPEEKENYVLKAEVTNYVSRRDEMRKWWLEKMKPSPGHGPGAQLGVEAAPRNAAIDQAMMMRQYGPAHRPSTLEEWETHLSWAHRRKYFYTIEKKPRWIRYTKNAFISVALTLWFSRYIAIAGFEEHKKDQSYRYSNVHTVDESVLDPHYKYRPKTGYPYFA